MMKQRKEKQDNPKFKPEKKVEGKRVWGEMLSLGILPIYFVYCEVLFRILINEAMPSYGLLPGILFSLGYGVFFAFLTSLIPNRVVNRILRILLLLLTAILFLMEYFIFRAFKMLYDVNTITNAAMDMVQSDYMSIGTDMIFSPAGILILALYLVPVLLYIALCWKFDKGISMKAPKFFYLSATVIYLIGGALLSVGLHTNYADAYRDSYQFSSAVDYYGLLTGFRLEFRNKLLGEPGLQFATWQTTTGSEAAGDTDRTETSQTPKPDATTEVASEATTEETVVYEANALDLDFEQLMEEAPNETVRSMDEYVSGLEPSMQNDYTGMFAGKNLILISAEAFTAEAIDKDITPTLYRMATKGVNFTDYYQPASAGTTGGEVQNIFGILPLSGGASMNQLATHSNCQLISAYLNDLGYYGEAYHNNDYMYYDRHITHETLGYSEGYMGVGNGMEAYIDLGMWPESDLEMIEGTVERYIDEEHFSIYYMTVSGHSLYSWNQDAMARKNRDAVASLEGTYSEPVLAYKAANVELDKAMEYLIKRLEEEGKAEDTVIVISADHFPYGLDSDSTLGRQPYLSELYGYSPSNYMERDHNRLILWCGSLEKEAPIVVDSPTTSMDILPTLLNLYGLPYDSRLYVGRDVFSDTPALAFNSGYDWKTDYGTYIASQGSFTPEDPDADIPEDYINEINTQVRNKINYIRGVLSQDYYGHVLGSGEREEK